MVRLMSERIRRNILVEGEKLRGAEKVKRIPLKVIPTTDLPVKPEWIRVNIPASSRIRQIKVLVKRTRSRSSIRVGA